MLTLREKLAGGLIGLLVGDALGVPYEFHAREEIPALARKTSGKWYILMFFVMEGRFRTQRMRSMPEKQATRQSRTEGNERRLK